MQRKFATLSALLGALAAAVTPDVTTEQNLHMVNVDAYNVLDQEDTFMQIEVETGHRWEFDWLNGRDELRLYIAVTIKLKNPSYEQRNQHRGIIFELASEFIDDFGTYGQDGATVYEQLLFSYDERDPIDIELDSS